MRREVLEKSISKITGDLIECQILDFLAVIFDQFRSKGKEDKNNSHSVPLSIFQKYMIATQNYSEDDIKICKIFDIDSLLDVNYWERVSEGGPQELREMISNINFIIKQLPKVLSLIQQHYISDIKEQTQDLPEELKGKSLLTVVIVEEENHFSSPLRLTSALGAISELYSVVATIEKESESDLIVIACDSGSDKSFDFLGLSKLIEEVKEIIFSIWDRVVFHRQRQTSNGLALISDSLPILEKIAQLEKDGAIEKEQAAILKKKIISGTTKFIEAGIVIPELESVSSHSPRQLMKPEPKLLVSPSSKPKLIDSESNEKIEVNPSIDKESLSDEESEMLDLLLKKSKSKKSNSEDKESKNTPKARKNNKKT